jgi:outer membrane protein OmpA-like peptidoglycan-associated protein
MRLYFVPVLAAAVAAGGCATKKYVNREVGAVNQKVEALSTEVEKTQERVKENEARIESVGREAQAGVADAKSSAGQAMTKAEEAEKAAKGKIIYTLTLSNDKVTFPFNRAEVSDEAQALIDEAMAPLIAENRGVYFEIEGHTDPAGPNEYNLKLGEDRARAVRRYLHERHGIALGRIAVISYGETKPVADNQTKEGRAQNRRVVLRVLE